MRVSARMILVLVACAGWALAGILAVLFVGLLGFLGLGIVGLLLWLLCVRIEIEREGAVGHPFATGLFAIQQRSRQGMGRAEAAHRRQQEAADVGAMFLFRMVGMALTAIGGAGFLLLQL
ncbi:MAG: hypothetical protein KIT20_09745 [Alphaproteobacteria bacterium]|nr:hypothetical protein [Alphaproteobacteria bacterium]